MVSSFSTQTLFALPIFSGKKTELYSLLSSHLKKENQLLTIATPNPEQVIQSKNDSAFLHHLQQFDVLLPDGQGIVWASQQLKKPITERIPGVEVVEWLCTQSDKILIVGGRGYGLGTGFKVQGSSDNESPELRTQNSELQEIVVINKKVKWIEGYQDVQNPTEEEEKVVQEVMKDLKPEIVLVAFGAPSQEEWVIRHLQLLKQNKVKIVMVVGGAIDMLSGKVRRAPKFVRNIQLEWLFRLIQEPWRWKRQWRLVQFLLLVRKEKLKFSVIPR